MVKLSVLFIVWISPIMLVAQEADSNLIKQIKVEAFQHSNISRMAHDFIDVCGSRLTNSDGYRKAVEWTMQTFNEWQMKNVAKEPWGRFGKGWNNKVCHVTVTAPYKKELLAYPMPWTSGTGKQIEAEVALLKIDEQSLNANLKNVKNKILVLNVPDSLVLPSFKPNAERYEDSILQNLPDQHMLDTAEFNQVITQVKGYYDLINNIKEAGAKAIFVPSGQSGIVESQNSFPLIMQTSEMLPVLFLTKEEHLQIIRNLTIGKKVLIKLEVHNTWNTDDLTGYNVVAEIPGSDPVLKDEIVMLGAHLDSWPAAAGATDNAAGCLVMMEAIRILHTLKVSPKRTIRIALWGGEEQGLLGSFGYVKKHFGNPKDMKLLPEQGNISAYYNLDNGTGKIRGIFLQNNNSLKNLFTTWLSPFDSLGARYVTQSNTGSTDHLSFDAVGIPAFQFIQDPLDYFTTTHHTNMDVYEHLALEDLKQAAAIVSTFVYNTAMVRDKLPRKPLPTPSPFIFESSFVK